MTRSHLTTSSFPGGISQLDPIEPGVQHCVDSLSLYLRVQDVLGTVSESDRRRPFVLYLICAVPLTINSAL